MKVSRTLWAILAFGLFMAFFSFLKSPSNSKSLLFQLRQPPHSADPLEYDYFTHHVVFRSVLGTLVSKYNVNGYVGEIAESWNHSADFTQWSFRIRKGLTFSNGQPVTASEVIHSWSRLNYLLMEKGSHSDLLQSVIGAADQKYPSQPLAGLSAPDPLTLSISLSQPLPKLLEVVSFGMYAIVCPSDYYPDTGKWKNPKVVTSSNSYSLTSWTESSVSLELRPEVPITRHPKAYSKISIRWSEQQSDVPNSSKLMFGASNESPPASDLTFFGSTPSYIAYAYCAKFRSKSSLCHNEQFRKWLKHSTLTQVLEGSSKSSMTFFPPGMIGATDWKIENPDPSISANFKNGLKIRVSANSNSNPLIASYLKILSSTLMKAGIVFEISPLDYESFDKTVDSSFKEGANDIYLMYTGILIEDPVQDLRFMFFSKEGVRLPDPDGSVSRALKVQQPQVESVSRALDNQSVVWPLGHFALGFWHTSDVDTSLLNSTEPPVEFHWLGLK